VGTHRRARYEIGKMALTLATIGYEGASIEDFIATLMAARVSTLMDVRELPASRRRGFGRGALSLAAEGVGIRYVHLRGLGDPKPGRDAARAAHRERFLTIFSTHLSTPSAQADLARAVQLAGSGGACLMCYERAPDDCHRHLVAHAISARIPELSIRHLGVKHGLAAIPVQHRT
jgi:uncharacterized protein (DUF488 family)